MRLGPLSTRSGLWLGTLVIFVGISLGVTYDWMKHNGADRQAAVDGVSPPAPAPNPVVVPLDSMARSAATTYRNARFGYVVDYPSPLLVAGNEADNGDGLTFVPERGDADIRVWGEYNVNGGSPAAILKADLANDCVAGKATYQVSKPNLVAYSCQSPKGRVVYRKAVIRGDTLATVRFEYVPTEQQTWAPVVEQMADSLLLDGGTAN